MEPEEVMGALMWCVAGEGTQHQHDRRGTGGGGGVSETEVSKGKNNKKKKKNLHRLGCRHTQKRPGREGIDVVCGE